MTVSDLLFWADVWILGPTVEPVMALQAHLLRALVGLS